MTANLVLQDAIERIFVGDIYGDIYAGIYVIRGENVVLLGEIVSSHDDEFVNNRIWIKKMMNYHNVVSAAQKHKKPLPEKSNNENERNGLRIEFSMAWYSHLQFTR
jgi:U6 snRNA-associated Sm-like protein LSm1